MIFFWPPFSCKCAGETFQMDNKQCLYNEKQTKIVLLITLMIMRITRQNKLFFCQQNTAASVKICKDCFATSTVALVKKHGKKNNLCLQFWYIFWGSCCPFQWRNCWKTERTRGVHVNYLLHATRTDTWFYSKQFHSAKQRLCLSAFFFKYLV